MGLGDQVLATGLAKGARARGKRIALGDGKQLRWDHNSEQVFRYNPNLVFPGDTLTANDIEWISYHKGSRIYNSQVGDRWVWNYAFHAEPGEFFFTDAELKVVQKMGLPRGFVVIEPNTNKLVHRAEYLRNKQWPFERYEALVEAIRREGRHVVQFVYGGNQRRLHGAALVQTPSYRSAAAILAQASLYVGSEGGLHHAVAAVGRPAVVMFGGWVPPSVLGYRTHINLVGGATEFCGLLRPCQHCAEAMDRISVEEALGAVVEQLGRFPQNAPT